MDFIATKIISTLLQPSIFLTAALALGIAIAGFERWRKLGRRLTVISFVALVAAGFFPIGNMLLAPLEERFGERQAEAPSGPIDGIILLGGFEDGRVSAGRGGLGVNESAERLTEGVRLALRLPAAKVIFTGGAASLFDSETVEEPVRRYLMDAGIAENRIFVETRSRNTFENAKLTHDLVSPKPEQRWVLVTSAYHMPRAAGVFRKAGFVIIPFAVDYRMRDASDVFRTFASLPDGLKRLDLAWREWLGLAAYWWDGRIDSLLPGP